jgi:diguanylate cyclase (GGDEF)-like protein
VIGNHRRPSDRSSPGRDGSRTPDLRERLQVLEARCLTQARALRALEKVETLQGRIAGLERERATLAGRVAELHAVLSLSRCLAQAGPAAEFPQAVLPLLGRACPGDAVALWRHRLADGTLTRVAALGAGPSAPVVLRRGQGIVGLAGASGQALLVPDVTAEPQLDPAELLVGSVGAYLAVPCRMPLPFQGGVCVGVLAAQSLTPRGYGVADLDRAQALSEPLGTAWGTPARAAADATLSPRTSLQDAADREAARSRRTRRPFAVLRLDLEPDPAAEALPWLAAILREQVRGADLVVHLGGAAFGLLLPESDASAAMTVAQKLRTAVALAGPSTVTVGYACCPADSADGSTLLELADRALARGKAQGGNCVCGIPAAGGLPPAGA